MPDRLPEHIEIKWDFAELTDTAATGDPTRATAQKGAQMEQVLVDCVAQALEQLDACGWDYTSTAIRK